MIGDMKQNFTTVISCILILIFAPFSLRAGDHLDKGKLPIGCATCHYKSNLKTGGGSKGCITCHGNPQRRVAPAKIPAAAIPKRNDLTNIEVEFFKTFRHPTFDAPGIHRPDEILPEINSKAPRHAECVDCHHPHYVTKENRFAGIKVRKVAGIYGSATAEAQVCYRCHGDSLNLPGKYSNKRLEFSTTNPSFHPVEGEGRNSAVLSLIRPYKEKKFAADDVSIISCSDCHGNDNHNGPKGVHGSIYRFILKDNFDASDAISESQFAYALCYRCHSRSSILANESFRFHSLHIQGNGLGKPGTSCFTCHNSHGSAEYKYLIKFNRSVVSPTSTGVLKFVERGSAKFSGECYLTCHGVEHNPKSY